MPGGSGRYECRAKERGAMEKFPRLQTGVGQKADPWARSYRLSLTDVTCRRRVETAMVTARFQLRRRSLRRPAGFLAAGIWLMAVCGCFLAVRVAGQNQGQDSIPVDANLVIIHTTVKNKAGQIMLAPKKD